MPTIRHWENLHCTVYFPYITCLLPLYVYVLVQMLLKKQTKKRYKRNIARHTKNHACNANKKACATSVSSHSLKFLKPGDTGLFCVQPVLSCSSAAKMWSTHMLYAQTHGKLHRCTSPCNPYVTKKTGPKTVQRTRTAGNSSLLLRTSLVLWQIVHGIVSGCGWALENINTTRTGQDKTETQSKSNQMTKIISHIHT